MRVLTGTSASAPTFAAMVSLLNEARLKQGRPAMGFINPFLYEHSAAFTDVIGEKTNDFDSQIEQRSPLPKIAFGKAFRRTQTFDELKCHWHGATKQWARTRSAAAGLHLSTASTAV